MPCKDRTPDAARRNRRRRQLVRRAAASDITVLQEREMRRLAHKCPLCGVYLTDKPYFPNSKHLDHILPINQGGTHTHGNVRIICAGCNLSRPKDGSDFTGQLTLWAQGPVPTLGEMCPSGLHEWSPANIEIAGGGKERCQACREAAWRKAVELRAIGWAHP